MSPGERRDRPKAIRGTPRCREASGGGRLVSRGALGRAAQRDGEDRACLADSGSPSQVKCNQRSIVAVRRIFFCSSSTP
jgi:hypothetical protein